jgi:hypothetical protein
MHNALVEIIINEIPLPSIAEGMLPLLRKLRSKRVDADLPLAAFSLSHTSHTQYNSCATYNKIKY